MNTIVNRSRRVVILGAAGRDFHNFNVCYREADDVRVVAFTATQIPGIAERRYPPELAGDLYPNGIPIIPEQDLESLCRREGVDEVVFAYSDVSHTQVMHLASRAVAVGADFRILGPDRTALQANVPVLAVSAARTGCGKSQVSRWLTDRLARAGWKPAAIRHPMPYGDLAKQAVQRFNTFEDLEAASCTLEEREEYEPYLEMGAAVFAGVDYGRILKAAEREANIVVWDGGNNDFPFVKPDLHIALVDALRPDQVDTHFPGEACIRMADIVIVNKADAACEADVERVSESARLLAPDAAIVRANSPVRLDDAEVAAGRRVIVIEDGPTISHGGMPHGAGFVAAERAGAAAILDPRESATPELRSVFDRYPHIGNVLPAMGYGAGQISELRESILASKAELVVAGTPIDLARALDIGIPVLRARYAFEEAEEPGLGRLVDDFLGKLDLSETEV
jgi:predicted GTPase